MSIYPKNSIIVDDMETTFSLIITKKDNEFNY
ncbi:hypothetical protein BDD26_1986 [Xenorhabdus cabanillasii]|uniref:Uncharacterized protein n=1 Tax=Xenorhabdus cabanillasii TaxID=351673 RepID=A0A3D9URC6_9GAMM|nr:hypothetical protein BDD26_1986 [Xenorhabdus cabanillasii]